MFKMNNKNSNLVGSGVTNVNFEQMSYVALMFPLLNLNKIILPWDLIYHYFYSKTTTTWKLSKYGVFLVRIFLYLD